MTKNETKDERPTEDNQLSESAEELDRENFELNDGKESGKSGSGFHLGSPAVNPYAEEAQNEEETDVETGDTE